LKNIRLHGLQMHIGSQLTDVKPFEKAISKMLPLVMRLKEAHDLKFFSVGGGLGIMYQQALDSGTPAWWKKPEATGILTPTSYAATVLPLLKQLKGLRILLEPGRFIAGNAGILVTRVEYVKRTGKKNFVIVDAAMNDLIRPAFYDSFHEIVPVSKKSGKKIPSDVVGPICESGDYFCKDRLLPKVGEGDCLALLSAGAYGFVMASNYNTRPMAAEVLVNGNQAALVRKRQTREELWADESTPKWLK
jgi:diaminopimelate decarboxylase